MMQRRKVAATMASDPRKWFLGTSPSPGDTGYMGLVLPAAPSADRQHRHLARLCSVAVPDGMVGRLLTIGQYLTLGACVPAIDLTGRQGGGSSDCNAPTILVERPVVTPYWSFPDGNVSWHVKWFRASKQTRLAINPGLVNRDNDQYGLEAALLTATYAAVSGPISNGFAPGEDFGDLGVWHDMAFSWPGDAAQMSPQPEVRGPCVIAMYASVYQTDPTTRLQPAVGAGIEQMTVDAGLVPEDKFMFAFPTTSRYYRIAGRMVVEIRCSEHKVR